MASEVMQMNKLTLSPLMLYGDVEGGWVQYQEELYKVFSKDFKSVGLKFKGKEVKIRYQPIEYGKEEAFFHITCQDYDKDGERVPDFRRCERISWVRTFIEAADTDSQIEFDGYVYNLKIWTEQVKNDFRYHILCEEVRFMVVVAERDRYCLLITAFYFEHNHSLDKKLKKYEEYIKAKNASH